MKTSWGHAVTNLDQDRVCIMRAFQLGFFFVRLSSHKTNKYLPFWIPESKDHNLSVKITEFLVCQKDFHHISVKRGKVGQNLSASSHSFWALVPRIRPCSRSGYYCCIFCLEVTITINTCEHK